jgi:hypothetical protein
MTALDEMHMAIAKTKRRRFATLTMPILAILAWFLPMAPAIIINVDWSGRAPIGWSLAAIAGIMLAAVLGSRHDDQTLARRFARWLGLMPSARGAPGVASLTRH